MIKTRVFNANQMIPGTNVNGATETGGNHPPKKSNTVKHDIKIIFAYSPNEKRANQTGDGLFLPMLK
jgi:hypothetical protein